MNAGEFSVNNRRIIFFLMGLLVLGGIVSYQKMGRLEDPEFTIKEALIITPYPGASADEVAQEITNPIENACQQLGQLDRVESQSMRGRSVVSAHIKARYHKDRIPQVWDELRRKINDVQSSLPPAARGRSIVVDDFGDVFGIFLAITGEGFTQPELRRYAEFLRRELVQVQDVQKVELFAAQQEVAYLEISRQRLAQLGINEDQIYSQLQARNIAADGGRVRVGEEHIVLDPTGVFQNVDAMLDLVIGSDRTGRQLFLRDVATVQRGYQDPPRRILRFDGKAGIGLGISTVPGGNVVTMGNGIRARLRELESYQPIGIEIDDINFQPEAVTAGTNEFAFNLVKAVSIVFVVLLLMMGLRAGAIVGFVLLLTILGTLMMMYFNGILMERISLGAFIIALCMLTDNALVVNEAVKVGIEAGRNKLEVVREAVGQNQWPLLGATAIAIIAFAAIGLSEDRTGEYCNSLFWVILYSLSLSWVACILVTPLLGYLLYKPASRGADDNAYESVLFRGYRALLTTALRLRWLVVLLSIGLTIAGVIGFGGVRQSFFPPATRPQFLVDVFLPSGTHIRESEAFAESVEKFIHSREGVKHVTTFVGGGGMRFLLVYSPEPENRAYVEFLVQVDDARSSDAILADVQKHLDQQYPDANAVAKKFLLGPGQGGRIQARFRGPDPAVLRQIADAATKILNDDGGAVCVRHDWREREKVLRPQLLELQARRNGITRVEVAVALESGFEGRAVGFFREPGDDGGGVYPQETRLLPVIARPPLVERSDVNAIQSMQIWSPTAGRMIPMGQVVSGVNLEWEDPVVPRRNRVATITIHADPRTGLPSELFNRVRGKIEGIELLPGYSMEWGGEYGDSAAARAALAQPLPYALTVMVFIVLVTFNSFRATLAVWLVVPMCIVGVTFGLLITGKPFGFMALLGVLSLAGELIKTSMIVLSKVRSEIDKGTPPYQALVYGSASKVRPILLIIVTTVLGMIPLIKDPFFSAMAVSLMFGLCFAALVALFVVPVIYAIFMGIREPSQGAAQAGGSEPIVPPPSATPA